MFDNLINSSLIYINDILNENGEINQHLILDRLKYKSNGKAALQKQYLVNGIMHNRIETLSKVW
jgi:hypothetical protein